jgi:outer membrane lipoprotein SlyB
MNRFLMILPLVATLAACETQEQNQLAGTLGGAALGAAVSSDGDKGKGVLIGGLAGLAAGTLIGQRDTQGRCLYERSDGSRYYSSC